MGHDHEHDLRSYGRRRGRAPSPRQAALWQDALPRFALDLSQPLPTRIGELFAPPVADVWLEIGFGGGEHLLWQARHNPGVGLIGCEPFQDGVIKVLSAIEQEQLANIRLHADDARPLLRRLPEASIGRAFILFPDPWPKARHHKRRLVSAATLAELARIMRSGAELRIATDDRRLRRAGCCWPLSDNGISAGRRPALPTGACGPPIGPLPATSRRPAKRAAAATISASARG